MRAQGFDLRLSCCFLSLFPSCNVITTAGEGGIPPPYLRPAVFEPEKFEFVIGEKDSEADTSDPRPPLSCRPEETRREVWDLHM